MRWVADTHSCSDDALDSTSDSNNDSDAEGLAGSEWECGWESDGESESIKAKLRTTQASDEDTTIWRTCMSLSGFNNGHATDQRLWLTAN